MADGVKMAARKSTRLQKRPSELDPHPCSDFVERWEGSDDDKGCISCEDGEVYGDDLSHSNKRRRPTSPAEVILKKEPDKKPRFSLVEMGDFQRVQSDGLLLVKGVKASAREKIPQCDSPVYDRNNSLIGTVCEVGEAICTYYYDVKMCSRNSEAKFSENALLYVDPCDLRVMPHIIPCDYSGDGCWLENNNNHSCQISNPPESLVEIGKLNQICGTCIMIKAVKNSIDEIIPTYNTRVFLENKIEVGKLTEIFGPICTYYFTVKASKHVKNMSDMVKTDKKFFVSPLSLSNPWLSKGEPASDSHVDQAPETVPSEASSDTSESPNLEA